MAVTIFCPCGIVTELSPEIDIFSEGVEIFPEEELGNMPPEEEEPNEISPEEDELELDEDELLELEELPEEDVELVKLPDDELEEELLDDEDVTQSAKPKHVAEFVGQQPLTQQREPHCTYAQLGPAGSGSHQDPEES